MIECYNPVVGIDSRVLECHFRKADEAKERGRQKRQKKEAGRDDIPCRSKHLKKHPYINERQRCSDGQTRSDAMPRDLT
uniref:Uncharacterized protein n=1 Tax=Gibberella zeae TaxID=5518 RepID=A0A4E9DR16_GIBZA